MPIADEKYVSLSTVRKSGVAVASPVWIVALPDGTAGFITDLHSGKVKRIRNNSAVTLTPCTARGKLTPGAAAVPATASVATGPEVDQVSALISKKYGLFAKLIGVTTKVRAFVTRKPAEGRCAVILTLD